MSNVLYDTIGPRGQRKVQWWTAAIVVALAAIFYAVYHRLEQRGQVSAELWSILLNRDLQLLLLEGLVAALKAAAVATILSLLAGMVLAAGRISEHAWVRLPIRAWIEVFRSVPLLLLIFFVYLGAPAIGINVPTFWSLVIGLALYNSAIVADIIRAGLLALPRGQREAGRALGLSRNQTLRVILIPQAVRQMLPTLVSQMVTVLKETALGFIIGYTELLRNGRVAVEFLGGDYAIPVYTGVAVIYISICLLLSLLATELSRRTAARGPLRPPHTGG
ncbi:amino acid ABC transporter permease [Starkeya sp. ORNL1]|uniref:amino acid ABC transporter permease n=1 Tax=Starkeya sp. ORNL1 TaxID=2709380 RepID=UPI0014632AFA|nr:amino acid ABC transporter permease [Starkeya sp. ORNL1]QJP13527.1 amino acid ABC transporter permease [Starkeya sp. ORNL1]